MSPTVFYQYRPVPPLDRFVAYLWYWEGSAPAHGKDRLMPDGASHMIINLAEDQIRSYSGANDDVIERFDGAVLVGAHSRYSVIDAQEQTAVVGITFRPGGTWPFFDPAADELHNAHANLGELWGSAGRTLRERLLAQPTPLQRLALLECELLAQAIRPLERRAEVDYALRQLALPSDALTIERLSERSGLCARQLTRVFAIEVGLTPKLYARIKRFERVFPNLSSSKPDWSEIALACGYFDQSHLIRDSKLISGFTPRELHARWSGNGYHVPI